MIFAARERCKHGASEDIKGFRLSCLFILNFTQRRKESNARQAIKLFCVLLLAWRLGVKNLITLFTEY